MNKSESKKMRSASLMEFRTIYNPMWFPKECVFLCHGLNRRLNGNGNR